MEKKIGILTFHNAINYGAVLQAYALERHMEKMGIESELINYRNPYIYLSPSIRRVWQGKSLIKNLYNTLSFPFWIRKYKKFNAFIHKVNVGDVCYEENFSGYSSILVGSDQVWNLEMTHNDFTYYLRKTNNVKKYAYASSFGTNTLDDKEKAVVKECLNDFELLSVRENGGKCLINELLPDKDTQIVLDPTFLLSAEEWKVIAQKPKFNGRYILIYQLEYSKTLIEYAQLMAKRKACKLITINGNPRQPIMGRNILDAGPEEWLGLFEGAEMIFTNSFHGTVFSIIFNKDFYTNLLVKCPRKNDRMITILHELGLENRILRSGMTESELSVSVNYPDIKDKYEKLLNDSYKYIDKVVS